MVPVNLSWIDLAQGLTSAFGAPPVIHSAVIVGNMRVEYGPSGITVSENNSVIVKEEIFPLGETNLPLDTLMKYLSVLNKTKFHGRHYNVLTFNCNTFAKFLIKELLGVDLQEYLDKLPAVIIKQMESPILHILSGIFVKMFTSKIS